MKEITYDTLNNFIYGHIFDVDSIKEKLFDEVFDTTPTFADVSNLLENIHTYYYSLIEVDDYDIGMYNTTIKLICELSHLVLNNAFYILSNGAENDFTYTLTKEDKKHYTFLFFTLEKTNQIIYNGIEGIVNLILNDNTCIEDDDLDNEEIYMLAQFFYNKTLK